MGNDKLNENLEPVVLDAPVAALKPEQIEALLTISSLLNSDLNAGRVLRDLLLQICTLFRANRAAVFLREKLPTPADLEKETSEPRKHDIGKIICAASTGLSAEYTEQIARFYEKKEFHELQSIRRPLYFENARSDPRLNGVRDLNKREGLHTMLTLPLIYNDALIGALVLYHDQPHKYGEQETRILTVFANQAAMAITNARLYEEARNREREAALLAEAGRAFNASLKTREVLDLVARASGRMIGNTALIYIIQDGTSIAHPVAFYTKATRDGEIKLESPVKAGQPVIKLGEGVIGKAMQTGVAFYLQNKTEIVRVIPFVRPEDGVTSLICVPLKTRGRIIGVLITYQVSYDQAPTKILDEDQLGLMQALADRAAVAIENARLYEAEKREQRVKDEFLTLVSHELNTPLTNIKGFNHLLSRKLDEAINRSPAPNRGIEGLRHYTEVIGNQIERLQRLITDLSQIPLIENDQLELHIAEIELAGLVRAQVEDTEKNLQTPAQAVSKHRFEIFERIPNLKVAADQAALVRILQILLANAVKYSPVGGIIRVEIADGGPKSAKITISDQGIGISAQDLPHIFDRFYKASTLPGRANGLGLGLYISRSLSEAMGGQLTATSPGEGKGATFILRLPRV